MPTRRLNLALIALVAVGCTDDPAGQPPLDELTLRDALGARPDVIAALPIESRQTLALRFIGARHAQLDDKLDLAAIATGVRTFDAKRVEQGEDAVVGLRTPMPTGSTVNVKIAATKLPALEGRDPKSPTDAIEQRALDGKAGAVLAGTLADRGAKRLVRVTQWPVGFVATDEVIYVNGSWLVAMAALDEPANANPSNPSTDGTMPPGLQPTPYTFCSVGGAHETGGRKLFWIVGPFLFVVIYGRRWKKRSARG